MAKTVEELLVYQKALAATGELFALIQKTALCSDRGLAAQLNDAAVRVVSDIAEGFEQRTDRHFARYLYDARGGASEIRTQLQIAVERHHLAPADTTAVSLRYEEIGKMLTGLIAYLRRTDWRDR